MANNLCSLWAPCSELPGLGLILCCCRVEMLHHFFFNASSFFNKRPHIFILHGASQIMWLALSGGLTASRYISIKTVYTLGMGAITKWL